MTISIASKIASYQQLIAGIQKNAPNLVLMIASQSYTSPQVVAVLQSLITAANAVVAAKSTWHDAVLANDKTEVQYAPLVKELETTIGVMYSNAENTLEQFGLSPKKPRKPLTTQALAARAAKAAATRKARGTTGKKQKAKVTGNVTGVDIVPITVPTPSLAATATTPTVSATAATPSISSTASGGATAAAATSPHA